MHPCPLSQSASQRTSPAVKPLSPAPQATPKVPYCCPHVLYCRQGHCCTSLQWPCHSRAAPRAGHTQGTLLQLPCHSQRRVVVTDATPPIRYPAPTAAPLLPPPSSRRRSRSGNVTETETAVAPVAVPPLPHPPHPPAPPPPLSITPLRLPCWPGCRNPAPHSPSAVNFSALHVCHRAGLQKERSFLPRPVPPPPTATLPALPYCTPPPSAACASPAWMSPQAPHGRLKGMCGPAVEAQRLAEDAVADGLAHAQQQRLGQEALGGGGGRSGQVRLIHTSIHTAQRVR